jgi:hypothetical protein
LQFEFQTAWLKNDPKLVAEATAFWKGLGLTQALIDERACALCSMAYAGGKLVGLTTVILRMERALRSRLATYRCIVAPEYRRQSLAILLTRHTLITMEGWSHDNPHEKVNGLATILEAHELDDKALNPVWGEYYGNLNLVGFTDRGEQIRVAWFRHARLDNPSA